MNQRVKKCRENSNDLRHQKRRRSLKSLRTQCSRIVRWTVFEGPIRQRSMDMKRATKPIDGRLLGGPRRETAQWSIWSWSLSSSWRGAKTESLRGWIGNFNTSRNIPTFSNTQLDGILDGTNALLFFWGEQNLPELGVVGWFFDWFCSLMFPVIWGTPMEVERQWVPLPKHTCTTDGHNLSQVIRMTQGILDDPKCIYIYMYILQKKRYLKRTNGPMFFL